MRRRTFLTGLAVVALLVPLAMMPSASGRTLGLTNRFAPSGIHSAIPGRAVPLPKGVRQIQQVPPSNQTGGCSDNLGTNVRADQDCTNQSRPDLLGRGQSQNETAIAVNPTNPDNVLAGQNDYREGDGQCGVNWSLDGGRHWGSQILPMTFTAPGFTAARHYWDAGGDPTVAFDSGGRAYYICLAFGRGATSDAGDTASTIMLFRSLDGGASWSFPGVPIAITDGTGGDGIGLIDKQYMTIDISPDSPYQDRIYVTWSEFSTTFAASPIQLAYSDDSGLTWTQVSDISGFSEDLCPINFDGSEEGTCNANQFSVPFTAPNGDVYATFQNFNNCAGAIGPPCSGDPGDNHNQMLVVKSTDGGVTFGDPVKAAEWNDLPDCFTYTGENFGRACVPTAPLSGTSVFRATNYPSPVAVSDSRIVIDFGSYINPHSNPDLGNCTPDGYSPDSGINVYTGVGEVGGCNNDILRTVSLDGGATFTGTSTPPAQLPSVNDEGRVPADQFWQWSARTPSGRVATSYYDRKYDSDQSNGFMDITLAVASSHFRVTDQSMPPSNEFPGTNGYSTFMGDYSGIAVGGDGTIRPFWTDSRNPIYTFDGATGNAVFAGYGSDVYTRAMRAG